MQAEKNIYPCDIGPLCNLEEHIYLSSINSLVNLLLAYGEPNVLSFFSFITEALLLFVFQVRSVDVKEALRLQKENNFVILDVRPEAEFKEVPYSCSVFLCHSFRSQV